MFGSTLTRVSICVAALLASPVAASAQADEPSGRGLGKPAFDPGTGSGHSYWGYVPGPADSTMTEFGARKQPLWAHVVDAPYHVARVPLGLVFGSIGASVVYLNDTGVLPWVTGLLGPRELPYGFAVSFSAGGLVGAGGGLTFYHNEVGGEGNRLRLSWKSSSNGHHKVVLGTRFREGEDFSYEAGAGYRIRPNARFFGLGYDANEDNESFYTQTLSWAGLSAQQQMGHNLRVEPYALFSAAHARGPGSLDDDDVSLATQFADDLPAGYRNRSDGVAVGVGLVHDSTTETGRPRLSGYRRVKATYFTSTNDDNISFWSYRGELQEFLPLWYDDRALAVRGIYAKQDPVDGEVPFQRMLTNDDPDLFRGSRDFRWRDRGLALVTAEMRWPLWAGATADEMGLDAYLFAETGQVFRDTDELRFDRLEPSYGGGIRLVSHGGFQGRIEYGVSDEEKIFRIRGDQVFQFQKGTLFNGRNPIPAR